MFYTKHSTQNIQQTFDHVDLAVVLQALNTKRSIRTVQCKTISTQHSIQSIRYEAAFAFRLSKCLHQADPAVVLRSSWGWLRRWRWRPWYTHPLPYIFAVVRRGGGCGGKNIHAHDTHARWTDAGADDANTNTVLVERMTDGMLVKGGKSRTGTNTDN